MQPSDLLADPLLFDGGQPVTLLQKRAGTVSAVVVRNAISGPLSTRQLSAPGSLGLVGTERNWSLNAADVGPAGVRTGDCLDDGACRWTIVAVSLASFGSRWRCVARLQPS
jgi:hypothetical protein